MCEAEGRIPAGSAPGSVAEALRTAVACLDYLVPVAPGLPAAACGESLATLGEVRSKLAAAQAVLLRRFDALDGHDADGYGSSSAWLAAMTKMTRKDAKAAVRQMRVLGERPHLESALGAGDVSDSWAAEIAGWLKKLPEELRDGTEKILADAAAAGASLEDLAAITAHALARWQAGRPDEGDDGFPDRYLQIGSTFGGAGVIRGDLTPECAAAVTAVLEALGKKAGPEDDRTEKERFHDALQLACELLLRANLVPDRAGADTKVVAHISLRDLRAMDGAPGLEEAWIRAVLGESGYLTGAGAEAAACDAMIVPLVTGTMDATALDHMIDLVLGAFGRHGPSASRQARARGASIRRRRRLRAGPEPGSAPRPDRGPRQGGWVRLRRFLSHGRRRLLERPARAGPDVAPGVAGAAARPGPAGRRLGLRARRRRLDPAPRPARAPLGRAVTAAGHRLPREHPGRHPPGGPVARPVQVRVAPLRPTGGLVRRASYRT